MSNDPKHANHSANGGSANGGYERRDIGAAGVLYFLVGLAVAGLLVYFIVKGLYFYLDKQSEAQQTPVNPLVTNAPNDTRKLTVDYKDYLKQGFPTPQLEIDERNQLDKIRTDEEQALSTYDYIDKNAGSVRIPIDRAMDLIAQRGLPVRAQGTAAGTSAPQQEKKGSKK